MPRNVWFDAVVIAALLAAANGLLAPSDLGWLRLNPSPYLLLPLLIGSRYGTLGGLPAGLFGALLVIALHALRTPQFSAHFLTDHALFLLSLPATGAVCGEIYDTFRRRQAGLEALNAHLQSRLKQVDADLLFLRESKAELERVLATQNAELSTLDSEIRRLMESDPEELFLRVLLLLNRQTRASDVAIYLTDVEGALHRKALLGNPTHLPERIDPGQNEMVELAMSHKRTVSIPEFWKKSSASSQPCLAVVPLLDTQERAIGAVLIADIPFIALHSRTLHLITLICRWAARVIEVLVLNAHAYRIVGGIDTQRVFATDLFRKNIDLAHSSFRIHNLPSSVALFALPDIAAPFRQAEFESAILANVRAGDYPAEVGLPCPHLAVLLPLTGERGARIFLDRVCRHLAKTDTLSKNLHTRLIVFEPDSTPDQIWEELTRREF